MHENLEALDNPTLYARRGELTREALITSRLPTWADSWLDDFCDQALADLPALATDDDVLVVLERLTADRPDECAGFVRHLARRLVRRPNPAAAEVLRTLLARAAESPARHRGYGAWVGCAALACDPERTVPLLVAQLGTDRETVASVCAVFLQDPATAFDRLGAHLVPGVTGYGYQVRARLLQVLLSDGIPEAAPAVGPAGRRRGFLAADDRWARALLGLSTDRSLHEAKRALQNVPAEVLEALRPPRKSSKKKVPEASLIALGTVAHDGFRAWPVPVDVRGDLVLVGTSPTTLTVRRLAEGLPVVADLDLPEGRSFPTERVGPSDSSFEARGVLDAVLHPDGSSVALASSGEVLLVALDGSIRASAELDGAVAHVLCFGAGGATLWVATVGDDGHTVTALDGATLAVLGRTRKLGEFPDPAWFSAHPHPTDDVGVFGVLCGQDGSWVKVIERTERGFAPRKQKLHASAGWSSVLGSTADRTVTAVQLSDKLVVRSWPELAVVKTVGLGGACHGGVVIGDHAVVAIAEVTDVPSRLAVHAVADGARVGEARWPEGERLVERGSGALVTSSAAGITVRGVRLPGK